MFVFCMLLFASPGGIEHSTLSEGTTGSFSPAQNIVVKNQDELRKVWNQLGIRSEIPSVDFSDELVVVVVSRGKLASTTEISRAEKNLTAVAFGPWPLLPLPHLPQGQEAICGCRFRHVACWITVPWLATSVATELRTRPSSNGHFLWLCIRTGSRSTHSKFNQSIDGSRFPQE